MPRIPRLVVPGYPHHVTQRGNRKQKTFFHTEDFLAYLELIAAAKPVEHVQVNVLLSIWRCRCEWASINSDQSL